MKVDLTGVGDYALRWYPRLSDPIGTPPFLRFASRSLGLVSWMCDAKFEITHNQTAFTDGKTIHLPASYFLLDLYVDRLGDSYYDLTSLDVTMMALSCINGSVIHEAMHVNESICDFSTLPTHFPGLVTEIHTHNSIFLMIMNLVEDLFIEAKCEVKFPQLYPFVFDKNQVLLNEHTLSKWLADEAHSGPDQEKTLHELNSHIIHLKNVHLRDKPFWNNFSEIRRLFLLAPTMATPKGRVKLAVEIYDLMKSMEESGTLPSGSLTESDLPFEGDFKLIGANSIPWDDGTPELLENLRQAVKAIEAEIEKAMIIVDDPVVDMESRMNLEGLPIRFQSVKTKSRSSIEIDSEFRQFRNLFRYLVEEKRTLGMPLESGSKIVKQRLWRIQTDQKVLSIHDAKAMKKGRPEIIILIDASGSMASRRYDGKTLFHKTVSCAYSAFLSLMEGRIATAIYAHSTVYEHDDVFSGRSLPAIYAVASFNMPLMDPTVLQTTYDTEMRFSGLLDVDNSENYDGVAVKFVGNRFSGRPGSKALLVLSDGLPSAGSSYGGELGCQHTAAVAEQLRSQGISVVSLSLVKEVMEANNGIYGSEFNIAAFDGNLAKGLQQVLLKISLGAR